MFDPVGALAAAIVDSRIRSSGIDEAARKGLIEDIGHNGKWIPINRDTDILIGINIQLDFDGL